MQQYPKEILRKKLWEASEDVQDLVLSLEKTEKIQGIGREFNLEETQKIRLEEIVNIVLIGLEPVTELQKILVEEIKITEDTSNKITEKINSEILKPVINAIREPEKEGIKNNLIKINVQKNVAP